MKSHTASRGMPGGFAKRRSLRHVRQVQGPAQLKKGRYAYVQTPFPYVRSSFTLFIVMLGVFVLCVYATVHRSHAALAAQPQQGPAVQIGEKAFTSVVDWQAGATSGLLISNNDGGELRLDANQTEGRFLSRPFITTFAINAAGAYWRSQLEERATLDLEIRGRSTPPPSMNTRDEDLQDDEAGWGPWQPMIAADARSQANDGAFCTPDVLAFPSDTTFLQFRVRFSSTEANVSAVLNEITIVYLNTTQGPSVSPGLPVAPILFGPHTLTTRPKHITRPTWSAQRVAAQPSRTPPRGIMLHQIDVTGGMSDTLALLRALTAYQTDVLGWGDMSYHYLIDETGNLYEGRMGGPTSEVGRLAGGDDAIHVALIGAMDAEPSEAAQETLIDLLAWLCQAYELDPVGTHGVIYNEKRIERDTIAGHGEAIADAPDPGQPLRDLLPDIREATDATMVRSRWYFPESNVTEYQTRLMFYNPGTTPANAQVTLLNADDDSTVMDTVEVEPEGHADVVLNDVLNNVYSLSAIVESNVHIIAERSMELLTDMNAVPGIAELSRVWYFAEGSTADPFHTYLVLFNPHDQETHAVITYMKGDGFQAEQPVLLPPRKRVVMTLNIELPDVGFGTRIIANRPIAAERTMRFGPDRSGTHVGRGITKLARTWYFAEGTTEPPFMMRLLLLNPNMQPTTTRVTFMTPDGTTLKRNYAIPPTTRLVVDVNEVVPALGVSTMVESDRPLAAERALYLNPQELALSDLPTSVISPTQTLTDTQNLTDTQATDSPETMPEKITTMAGTVSFGAIEPAYEWLFSYGTTRNVNQYLLFSNPSRSQAKVTVEFILDDGSHEEQFVLMPANSRYTLSVNDFYPNQSIISAIVSSTQPIVAERSMYIAGGVLGASTSLGVPLD